MKLTYLFFLVAAVLLIDAGYEQYTGRSVVLSRTGTRNFTYKETQPGEFANLMAFQWLRAVGLVIAGFTMLSIVRRQERLGFVPHDSDGEEVIERPKKYCRGKTKGKQGKIGDIMKLNICGSRNIENPTEGEIREAIISLDASGDAFLVLSKNEMTYVQCSGDPKIGFDLEYQIKSTDQHYRASKENITADEIISVFSAYASGKNNWQDELDWKLMAM